MTSLNVREARDPVCGMTVQVTDKTPSAAREGKRYYFCCPRCQGDFEANPAKYFGGRGCFNRWLEKVARANEKEFGGKPSCH